MASIRKLIVPAMLLAALGFALAAPVEAHTLKVPRAAKANKRFGELACNEAKNDPKAKCVESASGPCHRVSEHRVRCALDLTVEGEDGSQVRCRSLIEWSIRTGSSRLEPHFLGVRSCTQVKPPEPAPLP